MHGKTDTLSFSITPLQILSENNKTVDVCHFVDLEWNKLNSYDFEHSQAVSKTAGVQKFS